LCLPKWQASGPAAGCKAVRERITGRVHFTMMAKAEERSERLMQIPGIGATTASALVASVGNGHDFANGRQLAAWLGLVPGQYSSGGKQWLGRITKAGDAYL
jgi:transposase